MENQNRSKQVHYHHYQWSSLFTSPTLRELSSPIISIVGEVVAIAVEILRNENGFIIETILINFNQNLSSDRPTISIQTLLCSRKAEAEELRVQFT
jgi:hypothetical protein